MTDRIIICETPSGCTCGAPPSTPAGMHHCDCAVHPGWCGQPSCLPCEQNGRLREAIKNNHPGVDGFMGQTLQDWWRWHGELTAMLEPAATRPDGDA